MTIEKQIFENAQPNHMLVIVLGDFDVIEIWPARSNYRNQLSKVTFYYWLQHRGTGGECAGFGMDYRASALQKASNALGLPSLCLSTLYRYQVCHNSNTYVVPQEVVNEWLKEGAGHAI